MENLITEVAGNGYADSGVGSFSASFQRRIEFHPARKPFTVGLSNGGGGKSGGDGGGFKLETLNPGTSSDHSRPESGQAGKKKVDGSEFWDNGLDPELSFGMTFRRIGAGLENLGNTCFLNSVLQCLTYTEPLAAYLQSGKHQNSCRIVGFCALCAIQKHVSRALQAPGRILAPKDLVLNLRCISRNFRISRQEDAHEYMVNLLESMHKCCLPSGLPSESPGAYEKSLVHKIFGGRLRSQVKCVQCSYCSNKFDPFLDLSLEIAKADSVHKALTNFTAAEMLDGGEKQYQCQRCKQKVRALKQLTVHKAPYVLTVHLKRFRAHDPGQKIDKKVQFGPTLDMKPFVSGSYEGDLKYTLYGVLVHHGWSTHSGHYYCFVRTSSGMWYSLDDNRVVQVNERSVLEQKAYMLFYVRDRKNIVSRKPIDVQKENLKANVSVTKAHSTMSQQPKEHLQGCPNQNGVWHADTSASVNQKVAVNGGLSKEIHVKEASSQPGRVLVECPASEKGNSLELSSKVPSLKNLSEGVSIPNPDKGKTLQPSVQSVNSNGVSPEFKSDSATNGAIINNSKEKLSSKNGLEVSLTVSHNCNSPQVYVSNKLVTNETSQKINHVSNAEVSSMTPSQDSNDRIPERIPNMPHPGNSSDIMLEKYPIKSPNVPSCENIQVGEKYTTVGISPSEKSCDNSQTMGLESVEVSNPSVMKHESLDVEPLDCRDQRKLKKKKKVLNSQMRNIPLCLKFFRASLALRKKKSKRSKYRITILSKELLLDKDNISSDVGPSKSESTSRITKTSCHFGKKVTNSTAQKNVKTCNGDSLMNVIDGELRERIQQDGAVLATDEQVPKHSGSVLESDQRDAVESGASKECRKDAPQEGMSKLTRGLKETTIPQWDGIDLPPEIVESNANETLSIGYVLDEWDEEYDRGKRKKLRHYKHSFGEPNPFQEIATKKMPLKKIQLKKAKMSHTSSADQPFRI